MPTTLGPAGQPPLHSSSGRDGACYRGSVRDPSISRLTAGRLSPQRRAADLVRLRTERFDVLIIGGGVTGAGAARRRRLPGALGGPGRGPRPRLRHVIRSSKLVHGGLRYLEQFDFGLVHEALRERGLLATRLAPHLVRPMPFLVPLPRSVGRGGLLRGYYGAGVAAYDAFAGLFGQGRGHAAAPPPLRGRGPADLPVPARGHGRRGDPLLRRPGRRRPAGGHAGPHGGQPGRRRRDVGPGHRVPAGGPRGHRRDAFGDVESGASFEVAARTVIAATGVWSDDVAEMLGAGVGRSGPGLRVRASKGVHLVVPALGDHRRGRPDPAYGDVGAVRHPVGRALDRRHHRHRLASSTGPTRPPRRATSRTCSTRSTRCSTGR